MTEAVQKIHFGTGRGKVNQLREQLWRKEHMADFVPESVYYFDPRESGRGELPALPPLVKKEGCDLVVFFVAIQRQISAKF